MKEKALGFPAQSAQIRQEFAFCFAEGFKHRRKT
jgi:hypothetical protein